MAVSCRLMRPTNSTKCSAWRACVDATPVVVLRLLARLANLAARHLDGATSGNVSDMLNNIASELNWRSDRRVSWCTRIDSANAPPTQTIIWASSSGWGTAIIASLTASQAMASGMVKSAIRRVQPKMGFGDHVCPCDAWKPMINYRREYRWP